jgi:hypothetical protein
MSYLGAAPANRVLSSADIAQGAVTLDDINFTDQPVNMDITGLIDKHTMRLADGVTITGDVTISDDLVLSKISDDGNAITMTNDGSSRTITGSGSIEASTLTQTPNQSLTGMTGTLGSAVTNNAGVASGIIGDSVTNNAGVASGIIGDSVTQPSTYYVQGTVALEEEIAAAGEMLLLTGTTEPYVTWSGSTSSFGDGSSKVTGSNDYDFKFTKSGIYFISFALTGRHVTSNRSTRLRALIRGGSSSHSTTLLSEANGQIANDDNGDYDWGSVTATLVRAFSANDLINFWVDSDNYNLFLLTPETNISIFLVRGT